MSRDTKELIPRKNPFSANGTVVGRPLDVGELPFTFILHLYGTGHMTGYPYAASLLYRHNPILLVLPFPANIHPHTIA